MVICNRCLYPYFQSLDIFLFCLVQVNSKILRPGLSKLCSKKKCFMSGKTCAIFHNPGPTSFNHLTLPYSCTLKGTKLKTKQLNALYFRDKATNELPIILCVNTSNIPLISLVFQPSNYNCTFQTEFVPLPMNKYRGGKKEDKKKKYTNRYLQSNVSC